MNKNLTFGISAMDLGKKTALVPSPGIDLTEWKDALTINGLYSAGGKVDVTTSTEVRLLWDQNALYILFICHERAPRTYTIANGHDVRKITMHRTDLVSAALRSGSFGRRDLADFNVFANGQKSAEVQKGMTYISGDSYCLGDGRDVGNLAEITEIPEDAYECSVKAEDDVWYAYFALPWQLFGGFPEGSFDLQVYRRKNQSGEVLSAFPLDFNANYSDHFQFDPETFIETYLDGQMPKTNGDNDLDGERQLIKGEDILFTLPSGIRHWQRPVMLLWPEAEERTAIAALLASQEKTTEETLGERVYLAQRIQDSLILDGADFFFNQRVANPWIPVDPWVARRRVNEALRAGDTDKACEVLDDYLAFFRNYISWWYADHTFMNQSDAWVTPDTLRGVKDLEGKLELSFGISRKQLKLWLEPVEEGFRLYGQEGFFKADPVSYIYTEKDGKVTVKTARHILVITTGKDYSAVLDKKHTILMKGGLRFLYEGKALAGSEYLLPLSSGEEICGFGERFNKVNQRGNVAALWQRDAWEGAMGTLGNQAYKNIPLFHSTKGYAGFVNSTYRMRFDVGQADPELLRCTAAGPVFDIYFFAGTPAETMKAYMELTGFPIQPPKWVFEPWCGGGVNNWLDYGLKDTYKEQASILHKFDEYDIPHSAFYAEGAGWDGHETREQIYKIIKECEARGMQTLSWQYPHVTVEQAKALMPELSEEELPISKHSGNERIMALTRVIDFTNPLGKELLRRQWIDRFDAGIRGTMVDFGDIIPDEAVFADGRKGDEMHDGYTYIYAKAYRELFESKYGEDHVLYTRGAGAGSQHFAAQFGGDHDASLKGMEYAMAGGLSAAVSGLPFWGVDVGGYAGFGDEETYLRWTEFGVFCPIMRYHGRGRREPWFYDDFTVEVYRFCAWLRENLLPYSYSTAVEAHRTGLPMIRVLELCFPGDPEAQRWNDEYMYGPDLFVAPVHTEGDAREIYFPKGKWVSFWDSHDVVEGPAVRKVQAPINRIPVYVREGALVPMQLSGSLKPGASMSKTKVNAMLLTAAGGASGTRSLTTTGSITYKVNAADGKYCWCLKGLEQNDYFLVKGLPKKPVRVVMNGVELPEQPEQHGLYFEMSWFMTPDGTLLIRGNNSHEISLVIE